MLPIIECTTENDIRNEIRIIRDRVAKRNKGDDDEPYKIRKYEDSFDAIKILDKNIEQNHRIYRESIGSPVKYNDNLLLLHTYSGLFLQVAKDKDHNVTIDDPVTIEDKGQRGIDTAARGKDGKKIKNFEKKQVDYHLYLTPYISEWTSFMFNAYSEIQKKHAGIVYNKDLFYLSHVQPQRNVEVYCSYGEKFKDRVSLDEIKQQYLIKKVKQELSGNFKMFEEFGKRYVWLTHVDHNLFLCLKEGQPRDEKQIDLDGKPAQRVSAMNLDQVVGIGGGNGHDPNFHEIRSPSEII